VAREAEKALRTFIPQALVAVEEAKLNGLADVVIRRMTVRSEQRIDAPVVLTDVRVRPQWSSVFIPGPTGFGVTATLGGDGQANFAVFLPLAALARGAAMDDDARVELTGAVERADAPSLLALLLASAGSRAPQLSRGNFDGEVALSKAIGEDRATAKKTGHATLRVRDAVYAFHGIDQAFAPFDASFDLSDYTLRIVAPFVLESAAHDKRAVVGGAVLLPRRSEQNVAWDLEITADGKGDFKDELAEVFHCKMPPSSARFKVVGAVAEPRCLPVIAASKAPPSADRKR
jgi:hypothetical protein